MHESMRLGDTITVTFPRNEPQHSADEARILALIGHARVGEDFELERSSAQFGTYTFKAVKVPTPGATFIGLLDDLRNATYALGNLDEGGAEQAEAVLQLSEGLFKELAEAARAVLRS